MDDKEARNARLRQHVEGEILSTEEAYVRSLQCLNNMFIIPLKQKQLISEQKLQMLFSNLPQLCHMHESFLDGLRQASDHGKQNENKVNFGGEFAKFSSFFKLYVEYVNNHDVANQVLQDKLLNKNKSKYKKFQKFIDGQQQKPECQGQVLTSLLIMPIQRLPRYKLLLAELMKRTPEFEKDGTIYKPYVSLVNAFNRVSEVAKFINEAKRKEEGAEHIINLQKAFGAEVSSTLNLVQPDRYFVKQGVAKINGIQQQLVLFNDLVLIVKENKNNTKLDLISSISLNNHVTLSLPNETSFSIIKSGPTAWNKKIAIQNNNNNNDNNNNNNNNNNNTPSLSSSSILSLNEQKTTTITGDNIRINRHSKDLTIELDSKLEVLDWINVFIQHCIGSNNKPLAFVLSKCEYQNVGARAFAMFLLEDPSYSAKFDTNMMHPGLGINAFMHSCMTNDLECIQLMMLRNCDVNIQDNNGLTGLMHAAIHGSYEVIEYLVNNKNVDLTLLDNQNKSFFDYDSNLTKHYIENNEETKCDNTNKNKLSIGASVFFLALHVENTYKNNSLDYSIKLIRIIHKLNPDVINWECTLKSHVECKGCSPLSLVMLALDGKVRDEMMKLLLELGSDVSFEHKHLNNETTLMMASRITDDIKPFHIVLDAVKNIEVIIKQDSYGNTCLHYAMIAGQWSKCMLILDKCRSFINKKVQDIKIQQLGQCLNQLNNDQYTPIMLACMNEMEMFSLPEYVVEDRLTNENEFEETRLLVIDILVDEFHVDIRLKGRNDQSCVEAIVAKNTSPEIYEFFRLKDLPEFPSDSKIKKMTRKIGVKTLGSKKKKNSLQNNLHYATLRRKESIQAQAIIEIEKVEELAKQVAAEEDDAGIQYGCIIS